jgi:hypothetical protein
MPRWTPETIWYGQDVFIIGGGSSLKGFDWNLVKSECTIGCNNAFQLGPEVCKICIFGDIKWFKKFEKELVGYASEEKGGIVFTNSPHLQHTKVPWIWTMPRKSRGLYVDALGWNNNTGASAINLALLLGAKRIFLLGFDMHLSVEGQVNWHPNNLDKPSEKVFAKHLEGFIKVAADLKRDFPGREVINITKDSSLAVFQKVDIDLFWKERRKAS